ncbi:hypothetical protein [Lawsonella clevelandensis]|uniref:hypothetical protein n=1 Tax=Lawsonella clevelandensis TaxID=1528099 RepID=UPI0023EF9C42|nr:hypothetical protein [Lawsonella clevelandensis]
MYENVTKYIDEIAALHEDELIPIVHEYLNQKRRYMPSGIIRGTHYEYNPLLWKPLNAWSKEHFVKSVADRTKGMRPEDFCTEEWLGNLDEDRVNLTLSWLVTNEDYYMGTLAEWVKNGTFLTLLRKLKEIDEA